MGLFELFITAVALSMDAFAVAICKGLSTGKIKPKHMLICGLWFGGFQALMPLIGWLLGSTVAGYITNIAPYIAFALLAFLGIKMIIEAVGEITLLYYLFFCLTIAHFRSRISSICSFLRLGKFLA